MDNNSFENNKNNGAEQTASVFDSENSLSSADFPSFDELFVSFNVDCLPTEIKPRSAQKPEPEKAILLKEETAETEEKKENEALPETKKTEEFPDNPTQTEPQKSENADFVETLWQETSEVPVQKKKNRKPKMKAILSVLIIITAVFTLLTAILFAFSYITGFSLLGYRFYHMHTSTMEPYLYKNEMIIVKIGSQNIGEGDIVAYRPNSKKNSYLIHRVSKIIPPDEENPALMITKGDSSDFTDRTEYLASVIGVFVLSIPFAGGYIEFIRQYFLVSAVSLGLVYIMLIGSRIYIGKKQKSQS